MAELSDIVRYVAREVQDVGRAALYSPLVLGMTGCSESSEYVPYAMVGGILAAVGLAAYLAQDTGKKEEAKYTPTSGSTTSARPSSSRGYMRASTPTRSTKSSSGSSSSGSGGADYNFTPIILDNSSSGSDSGSHSSSSHSSCSSGDSSSGGGHSCGGGSSCGGGGGCGGGCGGS